MAMHTPTNQRRQRFRSIIDTRYPVEKYEPGYLFGYDAGVESALSTTRKSRLTLKGLDPDWVIGYRDGYRAGYSYGTVVAKGGH